MQQNIHDRARALSAQKCIPLHEAYVELARRGARKRNYGRVIITAKVLPVAVDGLRFWYMDRD